MSWNLLTLVVVAANVLGVAMAVPQALKLVRTRDRSGLSLTWAAISATVNGGWGVYGIGVGELSIVPVSVVSVMAYLTIAVLVVRLGTGPSWATVAPSLGVSLSIALLPVVAWAFGGWASAGLVLGALYGVQLSPAVVGVYRAIDVGGVSLATWVIAFVEAGLWGVYGWSNLDAGLLALAATGVVMSSLVLARLFLRRPRRRDASAPLGSPAFATA